MGPTTNTPCQYQYLQKWNDSSKFYPWTPLQTSEALKSWIIVIQTHPTSSNSHKSMYTRVESSKLPATTIRLLRFRHTHHCDHDVNFVSLAEGGMFGTRVLRNTALQILRICQKKVPVQYEVSLSDQLQLLELVVKLNIKHSSLSV